MISKQFSQTIVELKTRAQSKPGLCGLAVVRSVLASQFKIYETEKSLMKLFKDFYKGKYAKNVNYNDLLSKYGVTPYFIAYCFRKKLGNNIKILCSRNGDAHKLNYLFNGIGIVPIIHQEISYPEFGDFKLDGHYMVYAGIDKNIVRIFDPSRYGGLKYLTVDKFHNKWQSDDERWFLVVLPKWLGLDKDYFSGKYI
jgi:hypothetical protein